MGLAHLPNPEPQTSQPPTYTTSQKKSSKLTTYTQPKTNQNNQPQTQMQKQSQFFNKTSLVEKLPA